MVMKKERLYGERERWKWLLKSAMAFTIVYSVDQLKFKFITFQVKVEYYCAVVRPAYLYAGTLSKHYSTK